MPSEARITGHGQRGKGEAGGSHLSGFFDSVFIVIDLDKFGAVIYTDKEIGVDGEYALYRTPRECICDPVSRCEDAVPDRCRATPELPVT